MTAQADAHALPAATGVPSGKLGIWLFLASEIMLFSTLFTSYVVFRVTAPAWPGPEIHLRSWDVLNVPLAALNTFILIGSSVTMVLAFAKAHEGDRRMFRTFLLWTILLGSAFLVVKGFEYGAKFSHEPPIWPKTSIFYAVYFVLTGLHGLHVLAGIVVNGILLALSRKSFDHPLFVGRVEYAGLYWHFVDIVWIFLFPSLYLL